MSPVHQHLPSLALLSRLNLRASEAVFAQSHGEGHRGPQRCVLQGCLVFSCWHRALCKTLLLVLVLRVCNLLLGTVLCQVRQGGSSIPLVLPGC